MTIVKFLHKDYGEMETEAKSWIMYEIFDAIDKNGESRPVNKVDCKPLDVIEE